MRSKRPGFVLASAVHSLLVWTLVLLAVGSPTDASSLETDRNVTRLIVQLPGGSHPSPLLPYSELSRTGDIRSLVGGRVVTVDQVHGLEPLFEQVGAVAFSVLSEGLQNHPRSWERTYVVWLEQPISYAYAQEIAHAMESEGAGVVAEVDAHYELAIAPGYDWEGQSPKWQDTRARAGSSLRSYDLSQTRSGFFPNDPLFVDGSQWGLYNTGLGPHGGTADFDVRAPEAWEMFSGNTSTIIGAVDTGIDPSHPDLNATLANGEQRVVAVLESHRGTSSGHDSIGHGTMVMGVLGGATNNGALLDGRGIAGMMGGSGGDSLGARLVSVRATAGNGTVALGSDLSRGIIMAHDWGARAVNVSFASGERSTVVRSAMERVQELGTMVITAAGNSANDDLQYPGAYAEFGITVSIGALSPDGELAVFSTRGDQLDVVAPGEFIHSTWPTYQNAAGSPLRNYAQTGGTSFSAPFVTGIAGMAKALAPGIVANDFQEILRRTARDLGPAGKDPTFGHGLVDAAAIVERLLPPWAVFHGRTAAQSWKLVGTQELQVNDSGLSRDGKSFDGEYRDVEVWEVRAHVNPSVGLLDAPQAWVRYTGAGGWSPGEVHDYNYSAGEMVEGSAGVQGFDLRTNVFFVREPPNSCGTCAWVGWLPWRPEEVEFEWTGWARVDREPVLHVSSPDSGASWRGFTRELVAWDSEDPDRVDRIEIRFAAKGVVQPILLGESSAASGSLLVEVPCAAPSGEANLIVTAFDETGTQHDQTSAIVVIDHQGEICASLPLHLVLPESNPAVGQVMFSYSIPNAAATSPEPVQLAIFDVRGRRLTTIFSGNNQPGPGTIRWDGELRDGTQALSGVYYAVLSFGVERITEKFVFLR